VGVPPSSAAEDGEQHAKGERSGYRDEDEPNKLEQGEGLGDLGTGGAHEEENRREADDAGEEDDCGEVDELAIAHIGVMTPV